MSAIRRLMHIVNPSVNALLRKPGSNLLNQNFLSNNQSLPSLTSFLGLKTLSPVSRAAKAFPKTPSHQSTVVDTSVDDERTIEEVISKVNSQIENKSHGRLFAIIQLANRQWKITPEDVVVVEGHWPPNVGDSIRLEKVLLVGSSDFTLVGMPLLRPDLVNIQATVVEKRLSHTKTNFKKKRRKQYQRINFYRYQHTMIRINSITLSAVNEKKDLEGVDGRVF
ncbi:39S ribosomal protein L21, mitochondrial [Thrips palmi]|uniref:Large ribosomal subunit protein bL21m n=1 Tax=Thrips palmi TaxID=161013 RepID=A0A6P8ZI29_THRPL|nr:39S ribosomal protein L21, mitochondrial [Thrips palmi]